MVHGFLLNSFTLIDTLKTTPQQVVSNITTVIAYKGPMCSNPVSWWIHFWIPLIISTFNISVLVKYQYWPKLKFRLPGFHWAQLLQPEGRVLVGRGLDREERCGDRQADAKVARYWRRVWLRNRLE